MIREGRPKEKLKEFFGSIGDKWKEVKDGMTEKVDGLKQKFDDCRDAIRDFKTKVTSYFTTLWSSISVPIQSIINGVQTIFSWAKTAVEQLNELFKAKSLPDNTPWGEGTNYSDQFDYYAQTGNFFATGGFPNVGEIFYARENGPELIGSFGGNANAVANNFQIIEGIRSGVYDAVSSAMANGSFVAKVYLDSREIRSGQQRLSMMMGV